MNQFTRASLRRSDLSASPFEQFETWFAAAGKEHKGDPHAVALATANDEGAPSIRMVLLKSFGHQGFVFSTNYESRKGHEMSQNPQVALLFYWEDLEQQIRIEGEVERTSAEVSDEIFYARPLGSQVAAVTSAQSEPIENREELESAYAVNTERLGSEPKRPGHWGGYVLKPRSFEFWQGGNNRLHDRFSYSLVDGVWKISRLQP